MAERWILWMCASMALLLCGCLREESEEVWALGPGDRLPEFSVTLLDVQGMIGEDRLVTTSDLIGHVTAICLFDTSCGDCRRELPELQRVYENEDLEDVEFLCIARGENAAGVCGFWSAEGLTMPVCAPPDASVYHLFAQAYVPRVFIADSQGIIRASFREEFSAAEILAAIRMILSQS